MRTTATVSARTKVRAQPSGEARRTKDRMSFCLKMFAGCFTSDWALGITFAASGHQRTSPAKVRDMMHFAGGGKQGGNLKFKTLCITTLTSLTALLVPLRLAAQDKDDNNDEHRHHHYKLI